MECRQQSLCKLMCQRSEDWSSLVTECQDYAECCGFLIRKYDAAGKGATVMGSIMIFPTKYPSSAYSQALAVQPIYNELYHKVANDYEFLKSTLASTVAGDEFIRQQWKIYETVHNEGSSNPLTLAVVRSDYMYQRDDNSGFKLGQIEFNTLATSMAAVSSKVNKVHRYMARIVQDTSICDSTKFPKNDAVEAIADGTIKAWQLYSNPHAVVLFVVVDNFEGNFADIRTIEHTILDRNPKVKVVMRSVKLLMKTCSLSQDKKLILDNDTEVAVVYFREFYAPETLDDRKWDLRLMMERSQAIKSPSIQYQLAGSKKIQQQLALPGVIEKYLSPEKSAQVRDTFVGLYSLEENDEMMEKALKDPHNYVLKPQREGGGNNYYGEDIIDKWEQIKDTAERNTYILMERIHPPIQFNCKLSGIVGDPCRCEPTVTELGIYGAVIGTSTEIIHNTAAGYLLRSKLEGVDEGGFCAGYSAIDTPYLLSDEEMLKELAD